LLKPALALPGWLKYNACWSVGVVWTWVLSKELTMLKKVFGKLFGGNKRIEPGDDGGAFPPKKLIIPHDDYYGKLVGHMVSGDQFFITTPFVWDVPPGAGREFVALYMFSSDGDLKDALIDDLGQRADLIGKEPARILPGNIARPTPVSDAIIDKRLASLGEICYENIMVKPFSFERFGVTFGLIPDDPDEDEEDGNNKNSGAQKSIILEPGNYMAFYTPWDGEYDT
jgi:hypothetical protein